MPASARPALMRAALLGTTLLAVAACDDFDIDLRNNGANTSEAARQSTAELPPADDRGVISYPSYQVAVARRGDTVADVAARVGLPPEDISRYNGIPQDVALRKGELLALPTRVAEPAATTTGQIDIATLAGGAIERAGSPATPAADNAQITAAPEPIRHKVERGETAYSISRLYNVSVSALADWNGLGPDLSVREGQYLLIPVPADNAPTPTAVAATTPPGVLSPVPTPPSAASPLPEDEAPASEIVAASPVPTPNLSQDKTVKSKLAFPVSGAIIRGYEKKKNDGIDIAASAGTPVKAAEAGTVAAITRDTDQVPILVLRHDDNLLTVYANIGDIKVEKGQSVSRDQAVATVRAGDPAFLHFEVRDGFESVDPMPYLN
ncbi:peptidoglycan DD-metalloendopeptidase family protein [Actibacterium sp. D379-3]